MKHDDLLRAVKAHVDAAGERAGVVCSGRWAQKTRRWGPVSHRRGRWTHGGGGSLLFSLSLSVLFGFWVAATGFRSPSSASSPDCTGRRPHMRRRRLSASTSSFELGIVSAQGRRHRIHGVIQAADVLDRGPVGPLGITPVGLNNLSLCFYSHQFPQECCA